MGEVFRARDRRLGRMVAVKRIRAEKGTSEEHRARFRREARVLARLNHPAVVQLHDLLVRDDVEWLVMEYVEGETLRQRLERAPMSPAEAIELGRQIASGLAAAHAAGVIHRDLKTENVLITPQGDAKIVDFGVAKQLLPDGESRALTATGGLVGTVRAMSPEQVQARPVSPRSDLFSLGVLLYEAVCGESPFADANTVMTLRRIVEQRQRPAVELDPEVPEPLSRLIDHLLEKDPALRPRSAEEVSRALEKIALPVDDGGTTLVSEVASRPPNVHESSGRFPRLGALTAAMVVLASLLIAVSWPRPLGVALSVAGLLGPGAEPELPELPSIVVLPFANLSGDPGGGIFCDGLTDDLTLDLSRNPRLFVISRSSAFTYKGQPVNIETVGRELGVRYVLEGTVRRSEQLVRVTARLGDATTGFQIWSLRHDRPPDEIFALQSQISREILGALRLEIDEAELARIQRGPPDDLTAYHALLQGRALLHRNTRRDHAAARRLFERAIALDPGFADAYALLAAAYGAEFTVRWSLDPTLLERSEALAHRALELDPLTVEAYASLANVHIQRNQPAAALAAAESALAIEPNHAVAHSLRGAALAISGRRLEALREFNHSARLDPRTPSITWSALGVLNQLVGREQQAVILWERVRAANPDLIHPRVHLLLAYENGGRSEDAEILVEEIQAINPEITAAIAAVDFWLAESGDPEVVAARRERLRRAGLP